jgi:hypothetical protein
MTVTTYNRATGEALCLRHGEARDPQRVERENQKAAAFVKSRVPLGDLVTLEVRSGRATRLIYLSGAQS